jgi:hypothetical protein
LRNSPRLLTKLTLIPLHFVIRSFYIILKEKKIWSITEKQHQKLNKKLCESIVQRTLPLIHFNQNQSALIQHIREETKRHNQNNITRTSAYLTFFKKHPEIHWSFLAHMVSRNAGYFMSDLKGEYLPRLIKPSISEQLYQMLEKGNSYIFQDAYPQLLLYEESKRKGKSLFYLCRYFNVSPFMEGIWEMFLEGDHTPLLPVALIINEQSHIEKHLIQTKAFQKLKNSLPFRMQNWLQLSQILFPAIPLKRMTGKSLESFERLNERIALGQNLYVHLFHKNIFNEVFRFACQSEHTGSRRDYDPVSFSCYTSHHPIKAKEKLSFFKTKNKQKIYSPKLLEVWDVSYDGPFFSSDWFTESVIDTPLFSLLYKPAPNVWITYWAGLHKTETAYLLKEYYQFIKKADDSKV